MATMAIRSLRSIPFTARLCQIRGDGLLHPFGDRHSGRLRGVSRLGPDLLGGAEVKLCGAPSGAQAALVHSVSELLARGLAVRLVPVGLLRLPRLPGLVHVV